MFLINKSMCFIMRLTIVLETRIKTKKKYIAYQNSINHNG